MLSGNAADPMWLTQIPAGEAAVIVMEGVSMYLAPKELAGLFEMLEERFPSLCLLMDVYTGLGANLTRFKNPIHEVGVTKAYGIDDPAVPLGTSGIRYVREHSMTPSELVAELKGFEGFFFKTLFAGKFAKRLYRCMNINTDIDDFHMGFLPLRLVGLGDSQNRKMAFRTVCRSAIFPVCGHTGCAC